MRLRLALMRGHNVCRAPPHRAERNQQLIVRPLYRQEALRAALFPRVLPRISGPIREAISGNPPPPTGNLATRWLLLPLMILTYGSRPKL